MPDLEVANLSKEYAGRGEKLQVLRGLNLSLAVGENLAVVGPSGSGKSTLLHVLGTLERPTSGTVRLQGTDPFSLDDAALANFRNRRIGFVFQDHHLLPQLSVLENVLLPALASGTPDAPTIERAKSLLDRVGLAARLDHRPAEISGGERQRAAVARALLHRPLLLLADEPTGNLDRTNAANIARLLLDLPKEEGAMLIVVTHSPALAEMCQQQKEMDDGQLVEVK